MAGSNFSDLDQQMLDTLNKQLANVSASAVKGSASVRDFAKEITHIAEAMNRIENKAILNPKNLEQTYDLVDQIKGKMLELGAPINAINDSLQEESLRLKGQLIDYSKLGVLTKLKYGWEKLSKDEIIGYTKKGKEFVPVLESQVSLLSKIRVTAAGAAGNFASWATSLSGISLSTAGIAAKVLEAWDAVNRIHAMSTQTNAQWAMGNQSIGEAKSLIMDLHKQFRISVDQSGQYVNNLAKAGFEKQELLDLSKDLLANETLYGQAIDGQVGSIKNLYLNYNKTTEQALDYTSAIRQIAKDMPGLSMEEVLKDTTELSDKQKLYNTNLLSTVGLYTTLMNKKIADSLGLKNISADFKKSLMSGLAGASASMPDEWKAFFGMKMGAKNELAGIFKFEGATELEKLPGVVAGITELAGNIKAGDLEALYRARELIAQSQLLSKENSTQLAKLMVAGETFSPEKINSFIKTAIEQQNSAKKLMEGQKEQREKDITRALQVAADLQSTTDKLSQDITDWMMENVIPALKAIRDAIFELISLNPLGSRGPAARAIRQHNIEAWDTGGRKAAKNALDPILRDDVVSSLDYDKKRKVLTGAQILSANVGSINLNKNKEIKDRVLAQLFGTGLDKADVSERSIKSRVFQNLTANYNPKIKTGMTQKESTSGALIELMEYVEQTNDFALAFDVLRRNIRISDLKRRTVKPGASYGGMSNSEGEVVYTSVKPVK